MPSFGVGQPKVKDEIELQLGKDEMGAKLLCMDRMIRMIDVREPNGRVAGAKRLLILTFRMSEKWAKSSLRKRSWRPRVESTQLTADSEEG